MLEELKKAEILYLIKLAVMLAACGYITILFALIAYLVSGIS